MICAICDQLIESPFWKTNMGPVCHACVNACVHLVTGGDTHCMHKHIRSRKLDLVGLARKIKEGHDD